MFNCYKLKMKSKVWALFLASASLIAGCGGGGDDFASQDPSALAVSADSFNIQQGWQLLTLYGYSKQMKFVGNCSGTMQLAQGPATDISGTYFYKSQTLKGIFYETCATDPPSYKPSVINMTTVQYDENGQDAYVETETTYGIWNAPPSFPNAAKVGDHGNIGEITLYDLSKSVNLGKEVWTYTIEPRTATTAIVDLIKTSYLAADLVRPTKTEHVFYSISTTNEMKLLYIHWVDDTGVVFKTQ